MSDLGDSQISGLTGSCYLMLEYWIYINLEIVLINIKYTIITSFWLKVSNELEQHIPIFY